MKGVARSEGRVLLGLLGIQVYGGWSGLEYKPGQELHSPALLCLSLRFPGTQAGASLLLFLLGLTVSLPVCGED